MEKKLDIKSGCNPISFTSFDCDRDLAICIDDNNSYSFLDVAQVKQLVEFLLSELESINEPFP